jgi:membrane protein implicated in regulation of membrane protease activity
MNSSSPKPPPADPAKEPVVAGSAMSTVTLALALIPSIFVLVFHAGAAYMSYQRNQSFGWAILHFFLAVFYYPYYAFTQPSAAPPAESSLFSPSVQTAGKRLSKMMKRR